MDKSSILSRLVERTTTNCFFIKEYGGESVGKPPEYYFAAIYEDNLPEQIKSRFSIDLFFEDGELVHHWETVSERPTFTFHAHLQQMFINNTAVLRKWYPLELTLLNDFEKQPDKCDVIPDKEELLPGQETTVKISNIVDFDGRKSREFNRIIIQALDGEILGGAPLVSDPDLKAFQVNGGEVTFTYRAPDEENSQLSMDKIVIYNSCDILKKDEYPMEKTGLKDKIAEKKINLLHADAIMRMSQKMIQELEGAKITWEAKEDVVLKYIDSSSDEDDETFTENYDVMTWKLYEVKATILNYETGLKQETTQVEKEDSGIGSLEITFNSKTGKATEVEVPFFAFWFRFKNDLKSTIPGQSFGFFFDVQGGDGIHAICGGGTKEVSSVTYKERWSISRHIKKQD